MKFELENKEWKEFVFEDFFKIESTSSGIDRNKLINKEGKIPYLTRSEKDNAYDSFICKQSDKYRLDDSNVITIGLDTQTVFYQPNKFYTGQNIQVLKFDKLNKDIAQFLIPLIKRQMEKFNWGGNGATLTRLRRSKLLIPIKGGKPDYQFMEQYMQHKEKEKQKEYQAYVKSRLVELKNTHKTVELNQKEWSEFFLNEIFTKIQRGKRLKKADHKIGNQPYISSTGSNNGLDGYIGNKEGVRIFDNCITLANSGSVGSSFYQPYSFVASDHITKLENKDFNKSINLFISSIVSRLGEKYSFNREMNDTRIKREKIMLPINKSGKPDYKFMENYMKNLEYKKLTEYLEYKMK